MLRKIGALVLVLALAVSTAYADKTEETNVKKCQRFYDEVANKGNFAVIDELIAEDFVDHEVFPGLKPDRDGVKEFFTMMRNAFPDLTIKVDFYVADDDKVVAYLTMSGTHKGEFMGMAPTGKKISTRTIDILRIKDGKAVEHWGVTDALTMMEQLGMKGEPPGGE